MNGVVGSSTGSPIIRSRAGVVAGDCLSDGNDLTPGSRDGSGNQWSGRQGGKKES